ITAMENPESRLLPVESLFADLPAYTIHDNQKKAVYNGAAVRAANLQPGLYRVFAPDGEFLMVGKAKDGQLTTVKSFFEVSKP
ncbi:MAG: tRNA pseudouridine(55) synthase TruB, partial [Loktanella sp.]|nr:tRNA pseudouridine(55) synthase TruB [Loktanella sp.]